MLQRIQTVYLVLAAVVLGLVFLFPFGTAGVDAGYTVTALSVEVPAKADTEASVILPGILAGAGIVIAVVAIFLYTNRPLQRRIARFGLLLSAGVSVSGFFEMDALTNDPAIAAETVSYGAGLFLPIAAVVLFLSAARSIRKDEKLVKSSDSFRAG